MAASLSERLAVYRLKLEADMNRYIGNNTHRIMKTTRLSTADKMKEVAEKYGFAYKDDNWLFMTVTLPDDWTWFDCEDRDTTHFIDGAGKEVFSIWSNKKFYDLRETPTFYPPPCKYGCTKKDDANKTD